MSRRSSSVSSASTSSTSADDPSRESVCWGRFALTRRSKCLLATAALLLLVTIVSMALFQAYGDALFPWYRQVSSALMGALAMVSSIAPFSLWPLLVVALIVALLVRLVYMARRRRSFVEYVGEVLVVVFSLVCFFNLSWGLNHYAPPLADELGLQVEEYSRDDLLRATQYYLDQAAVLAESVERDDEGHLTQQDFGELAVIAGSSYEELGGSYEVFRGVTLPVKKLLAGDLLLMTGHNGIFIAFTGEASVPENASVSDIPFTMCHEAAHRLGIGSEKEANFCAILACASNDDVRFRYSGYLKAFVYCFNALASNYPDATSEVLARDDLPATNMQYHLVIQDVQDSSAHYAAYEGPLEEVGTKANDLYLKSYSEQDGVRSYGQVVDYLIAWHGGE
ncbi:MAG: DUF3810 domain-containing protein [Eggerthellales bacterium]|nr:DUF3810 domain-containing protein [Eggerthellales bacterium]